MMWENLNEFLAEPKSAFFSSDSREALEIL